MPNAYIGAGVAKGAEQALKYHQEAPVRELRLQEAQLRQQKSAAQLQEWTANAPNRQTAQELELQQLRGQLQKQNAEMLKNKTFETFRMYDADGDTRHLNRFLAEAKQNPAGQRIYGHFAHVEKLSDSPEVQRMLAQAGYHNPAEVMTDPELIKDLVIATNTDGTRSLVDMNEIYAGTGYTQYMTEQELANLTKRAAIKRAMRGPESAVTAMIQQISKEQGISVLEATQEYYKAQRLGKASIGGSSAKERMVEQYMSENPGATREQAISAVEPTAKTKEIEVTKGLREDINLAAGGDIFEADLTNPQVRRKVGPLITELEKMTGKTFSNEEKRFMRDTRTLINLGGTAGSELGEEETGLVDKFLRDVKKYVSDNVEGTAGTSSYESFRNVFRNALYGASLTQAEIDAFQRAAGSLKEQLGPTLAKLRTQMATIKDSLQGMYDMQDETIAYYYVGSTLDDIDGMVEALDERIALIDDTQVGTGPAIRATNVKPMSDEQAAEYFNTQWGK